MNSLEYTDGEALVEKLSQPSFSFSITFPVGFEFGCCYLMHDKRFSVAVHTLDKNERVWGTGYGDTPQEACNRAVERCQFHFRDKYRADGFVTKDWKDAKALGMTKNVIAGAKPKKEIETDVDLSNLKLEL